MIEIKKGLYGLVTTQNKQRSTDRQAGREESIHTRNKLVETGKQITKVREGDRGDHW